MAGNISRYKDFNTSWTEAKPVTSWFLFLNQPLQTSKETLRAHSGLVVLVSINKARGLNSIYSRAKVSGNTPFTSGWHFIHYTWPLAAVWWKSLPPGQGHTESPLETHQWQQILNRLSWTSRPSVGERYFQGTSISAASKPQWKPAARPKSLSFSSVKIFLAPPLTYLVRIWIKLVRWESLQPAAQKESCIVLSGSPDSPKERQQREFKDFTILNN